MLDPILDEINNRIKEKQSEFDVDVWLGEFGEWKYNNDELALNIFNALVNDNICG